MTKKVHRAGYMRPEMDVDNPLKMVVGHGQGPLDKTPLIVMSPFTPRPVAISDSHAEKIVMANASTIVVFTATLVFSISSIFGALAFVHVSPEAVSQTRLQDR